MKSRWVFAGGTIAGSLAIALGVALVSQHFSSAPQVSPVSLRQMSGQAGYTLAHTYLSGGRLQQGLEKENPEEYLIVETGENIPRFLVTEFTVHIEKIVSVTLRNNSTVNHHHNWTLVNLGKKDEIQEAAKNLDSSWNWIPDSPHILAFVPLTQPGQSSTILFRAPSTAGDYPFLCTYPGQGNSMNGILHVVE